ncbi:hypothetical protein PROFUN_03047 [Planoprotostelium fungivorum]|uniref:Uncharacterized protein n=1 Tax=Planoprotostelium fungivorum TaxID=1890364 RepID=A0A2P6NQ23_9EUKA|nr:hypothetical protein PROFUN_03047 [Planoprotostelium fungivorum]
MPTEQQVDKLNAPQHCAIRMTSLAPIQLYQKVIVWRLRRDEMSGDGLNVGYDTPHHLHPSHVQYIIHLRFIFQLYYSH